MKPIVKTILACGVCGDEVYTCYECGDYFDKKDDILCKEMIDEHRHYHKGCA